MLKFPITTKEDLREAAKIEKRRQYEEERKKRIFNGKKRLYGLDYEALEKQIAEKTYRKNLEAERERKYVEETQRQANLLRAKDIEQEKAIRARNCEMNYFRCFFQGRKLAREFDLNDKSLIGPARLADDDPRLGISSAQVFAGEDLNFAERRRAQRDQQRAWLDQQIKEREQADADRKKADSVLQNTIKARDQQLVKMSVAERENENKINEAIRRYNQELATRRRANNALQKQQTQEDDLAEIYNMLGSDMLTENPDVAQSKVSLNKKIAYLYRGMTPEETEIFRAEQYRQLVQNKKRKDEEKMKEKLWEQYSINMSRELLLKQRELEKKEKELILEQYQANRIMADEQKARKNYLDKVVYRNHASDEYWDQFNRNTR